MELAIPLVGLAGVYFIMNNKKNEEGFGSRGTYENRGLPNVDVPDRNYPEGVSSEIPIVNETSDLTSELSTVNKYDGRHVYTDKYFNPNSSSSLLGGSSMQNSSSFSTQIPENPQYMSLTGEKVSGDYFQHNNMAPFFGSHLRTIRTDANSTESIMDNYSGAGSQIITKQERAPLFSPQENLQWANGAPNMTDFYQSRVNPSARMHNVKPFAEQHVAPALGGGYGTAGSGGFNSGLNSRDLYLPKTADEMRAVNNPKASEYGLLGHEGPAMSHITALGIHGHVEKNRVDTSHEMGHDRLFTTVGAATGPTSRAIPVTHTQHRTDTSTEYAGIAGYSNPATYQDGEYMPSKHIDLGPVPIHGAYRQGANGANEADYGYTSKMQYQNNRSTTGDETYFGSFGGAIGAVVAPLLDALRPSRRENTIGSLRPYQNPGTTVSNSYIFNPADKVRTTIKETTVDGKGHLFVNRNQIQDGAYLVTEHQPIVNSRQWQHTSYTGVGSAGERGRQPRAYDAEYNQRNNDNKSSTVKSYTPAGANGIYSGGINMRTVPRDLSQKNNRAWDPTMPYQTANVGSLGQMTSSNQNATTYSNIQLDRSAPDVMTQLKGNPFALSVVNGL